MIVKKLLETVKERESQGYLYEGAEASFELLVRPSELALRGRLRIAGSDLD